MRVLVIAQAHRFDVDVIDLANVYCLAWYHLDLEPLRCIEYVGFDPAKLLKLYYCLSAIKHWDAVK